MAQWGAGSHFDPEAPWPMLSGSNYTIDPDQDIVEPNEFDGV